MSHSSKEPGSSSSSSRSRAVSLPLACCCAMRRSPPPRRAAARFSSSWRRMSCIALSPPSGRSGISPRRRAPAPASSRAEARGNARPAAMSSRERGAAARLLRILAPLLDLEALVELRQRRRPLRRRAAPRASASATTSEPQAAVARWSAASVHRVVGRDRRARARASARRAAARSGTMPGVTSSGAS